uniref:PDZ domain-containing protein n=1 Tax=Electrophorus electricus TaxID=8005 RepID=A0A4W4DYX1_ELEEL
MGTGDYVCITVRGRAPWGFLLRQSDAEPHHPLQVETNSHASLAGLCENDELLSVNGEPCSTLNLSEAIALIEDSTDCLQLLVKREIYISESQDEAYYGETDSEAECPGGAPMVRTQFCITAPKDKVGPDSVEGGDPKLAITPGSMVELQLSLSKTTLEDTHCASLGCARGVEGVFHHKTNNENDNSGAPSDPGCSFFIPRHDRKPLAQRGVLVSSPCALQGQVEVVVQSSGRGSGTERVGACGAEEGTSERLDSSEGEGGQTEEAHVTTVSFGIASEEGDSESEREQSKPNKHRARHARLRRSESLSEKQVKEAKSKCKRIALLLTAAAPNPNNKGLLMFKKHRQRAKQYTIVSYGTGDNEPEFEDEEAEEDNRETHAVEVTVLATSEAELDEDFFTNPPGHKSIVTFDWDTGLLEIERKINSKEDMNTLPETKGKGALMFAQRRQRMDEIAAEHEEMRRKGIPEYQQQQYRQHQPYQEQQQLQQSSHHLNGMSSHQTTVTQSSVMNRSAKPFSVENRAAAPFTPSANQEQSSYSVGQGEQIASRDERISVPAIKTGVLQDKRRNKAKPMFTFKEPPKVSPNPELLNLLNRGDRKAGFESGPEEDYLSLGAEACNFLQSPKSKHKIPPPVAPKPHINPASPPWSPQPEIPVKPWSPPKNTHPTPPQRMHSYTVGTKLPSPSPMSNTASLSGMGSAFEMPALRGKGAELFAKRQSRMEKYVVDSASVQANKARPSSPSPSLPTSWKYSTTCRAPPPLTYNPIQSPSYPPGAIKQPPSSSPSLKNKNKGKEKDKPAPKPLHVLDVMKHQPYQLNASLFTYGPAAEKLAAEKEAAEKFAAQKAAEAQAQAQAQAQTHIQALGRSSSLSPPIRLSPLGLSSRSASVSPRPSSHITYSSRTTERQAFWVEKSRKPPTPWEAASRHPLGLVDEAFAPHDMQQSLASSLRSAVHRKLLPEPPLEWKAKGAHVPRPKSQGWSTSRAPLPFFSPAKSTASAPEASMLYGPPLGQFQPPRSITEANLFASQAGQGSGRFPGQSGNRAMYSSTWRR